MKFEEDYISNSLKQTERFYLQRFLRYLPLNVMPTYLTSSLTALRKRVYSQIDRRSHKAEHKREKTSQRDKSYLLLIDFDFDKTSQVIDSIMLI